MKKKFIYRENYRNELVAFLNENKIKYTEKKNEFIGMHLLLFTLDDLQLVEKIKEFTTNQPIIEVKYSSKELESSHLLRIHAKRQEINIINEAEAFEFDCEFIDKSGIKRAYHKKQVNFVKIDKLPKEKNGSVFYSSTIGFGELFADIRFYLLCKNNNISGVQFASIYNKKGEEQNSLFQLTTDNIIPESNIVLGNDEKIVKCPICNRNKIIPPQAYELHLNLNCDSINQDFYITERIFNEGISEPYFLISQKLYQLLLEAGLVNDLEITPVYFC